MISVYAADLKQHHTIFFLASCIKKKEGYCLIKYLNICHVFRLWQKANSLKLFFLGSIYQILSLIPEIFQLFLLSKIISWKQNGSSPPRPPLHLPPQSHLPHQHNHHFLLLQSSPHLISFHHFLLSHHDRDLLLLSELSLILHNQMLPLSDGTISPDLAKWLYCIYCIGLWKNDSTGDIRAPDKLLASGPNVLIIGHTVLYWYRLIIVCLDQ